MVVHYNGVLQIPLLAATDYVPTITTLDPKYLDLLSAEAAVSIIRELLWAEADRAGIGVSLISVPGAINVADAGPCLARKIP